MPYGLTPHEIEKIRSVFAQHPEVRQAVLYGSRALGRQRENSDIDLTLIGKDISYAEQTRIDSKLDDLLLPYPFDLSIHRQIENESLLNHIERVGTVFYKKESITRREVSEWPVKAVDEIAEHSLGKMLDKKKNIGIPRDYLRNVNVRWFKFDLIDLKEMRIRDEEVERYSVRNGDLVICEGGYPGRCAIWDKGGSVFYQKALHRVRCPDKVTAKWLQYFLLLSDLDGSLRDHFTGAGIQHFTHKALGKLTLPFPPLAEQERIVAILDEAFEGLATATAHTRQKLQNARELFQSTLQSTFQQKGEGWVETTLDQMAVEFGRGKSKHRPRNAEFLYGGNYPFVQTGDIRQSDHFITEYSQTYSEDGLTQSKLWPKGTICITIAANIAETGILNFNACFPDSVIGMTPDPQKTLSGYVEYLLQFLKVDLQKKGQGSAQANINLGTFKELDFPFAPLPQQRTIVSKLDALSASTRRLESLYRRQLAAYAELKQSLLHQAFSGQL